MKKPLIFILIITWMIIIFTFSAMNSNNSNSKSLGLIKGVVSTTTKILHINVTDKQINKIATTLNYPVRKCAHVTVYLVLGILLMNLLYNSDHKKIIYIIIAILFAYASTDEFHQSFTGRTSSLRDVVIDTLGGCLGIIIYLKYKSRKLK